MFSSYLTSSYPEVISFLTNAINKNKLANSYIFISKDTGDISLLALNLAQILNCTQNKYSVPCKNCTNCKWLENNEHPQAFITIKPEQKSKKDQVKIDSIRELLNALKMSSNFFRVILFEKANLQNLPQESCNLLLKTVEETPDRTLFIFASKTKNDILPTISSRSQFIYLTKNYNSLNEIFNQDITTNELSECFSNTLVDSIEKAKKAREYITENEIDLKDYLISLTLKNYEQNKYSNQKSFCYLYEQLNNACLKSFSFMQQKIVLEDLFIQCTNSN